MSTNETEAPLFQLYVSNNNHWPLYHRDSERRQTSRHHDRDLVALIFEHLYQRANSEHAKMLHIHTYQVEICSCSCPTVGICGVDSSRLLCSPSAMFSNPKSDKPPNDLCIAVKWNFRSMCLPFWECGPTRVVDAVVLFEKELLGVAHYYDLLLDYNCSDTNSSFPKWKYMRIDYQCCYQDGLQKQIASRRFNGLRWSTTYYITVISGRSKRFVHDALFHFWNKGGAGGWVGAARSGPWPAWPTWQGSQCER